MNFFSFLLVFSVLIIDIAALRKGKTSSNGNPSLGRFVSSKHGLSSRNQKKTISLGRVDERTTESRNNGERKSRDTTPTVGRSSPDKRASLLNLDPVGSSPAQTLSEDDDYSNLPDSNCYFDTPSTYTSVSTCISSTTTGSTGRAADPPPHCINDISELVFVNGSFSADQSFLNCLNNIPDAASLASFYNGSYHGCLLMETTVTLLNLVKVDSFLCCVFALHLSFLYLY
jgi:hypothetical protein